MTRQTPRSDPGLEQGRARGEDPALPRGGERQACRLQVEVEPVRRRPDDQGARRGHPPPGWGGQGKLVAGRYTSLVEESEKRVSNVNPGGSFLIPLQEAYRCFTVPSSSILFIGISFVGLWGTCQIR